MTKLTVANAPGDIIGYLHAWPDPSQKQKKDKACNDTADDTREKYVPNCHSTRPLCLARRACGELYLLSLPLAPTAAQPADAARSCRTRSGSAHRAAVSASIVRRPRR